MPTGKQCGNKILASGIFAAQIMNFSIKNFISKGDQIRTFHTHFL